MKTVVDPARWLAHEAITSRRDITGERLRVGDVVRVSLAFRICPVCQQTVRPSPFQCLSIL